MTTADIVVAGAGHNSLLTACYLAKAGYRCLVLDARSIPGGGAATEELLLPGFGIDTCATGHTMIRVNPALLRDLIAETAARFPDRVVFQIGPEQGTFIRQPGPRRPGHQGVQRACPARRPGGAGDAGGRGRPHAGAGEVAALPHRRPICNGLQ